MRDVNQQLADYLDHVVLRVEAEDIYATRLEAEPVRSRQQPWAYALVALVAILLVGVGAWLIRFNEEPPASLDQPTLDDFLIAEVPSDFGQILGTGPFLRPPGLLSNGTRFLTQGSDGTDWVSSDGLTWSPNQSGVWPFYGGKGEFLAITTDSNSASELNVRTLDLGPEDGTRLWRSSDGLDWREAEPQDEAPWKLATYRYFGLEVDEILSLSLSSLPGAWTGGGPTGAILKLDDTYIAYYFSEGYWSEIPLDGESHYLEAAVSNDGRTWRPTEAPDFLKEWFHGDHRAMWDMRISEQTWSWTFAVKEDRVLALTGDANGHTLRESADGLLWEPISIVYLDQPSFDVFGAAAEPRQAWLSLQSSFTYRVAAIENGWAILPLGFFQPGGTEATPAGRGVLFSTDGHNWLPLNFRLGLAAAVGDKIFVRTGDLLVATFEGPSN